MTAQPPAKTRSQGLGTRLWSCREHAAQPRQHRRPDQQPRRQGRDLHREAGGGHAEEAGHAVGLQGPDEGGEKGGVVEGVHADHGDGEDGRGQGRAEEGGEKGRHARGGGDAQVPLVKAEEPPHPIAQGAPHLEGRPLPPGGAAAEMGQHRPQEDGGDQEDGDAASLVNLIEDVVGPLALGAQELVEPHDGEARQGQEVQQPGMLPPELRDELHRHVKRRAHQAAGEPRRRGQQQPLPQSPGIEHRQVPPGPEVPLDVFQSHTVPPPLPRRSGGFLTRS